MMIRILQISVVTIFILTTICGLVVLFACPDKMEAYGKLIGIIYPVFLAQVIPALIGTPLTEAVRAMSGKKEEKKDVGQN